MSVKKKYVKLMITSTESSFVGVINLFLYHFIKTKSINNAIIYILLKCIITILF